MEINSINEVKAHFLGNPLSLFGVGVAVPQKKFPRSIALGISKGRFGMPVLAVRCFGARPSRLQRAFVEVLNKFSRGEVEVKFLQRASAVDPMASGKTLLNQTRVRPLRIGYSVSHSRVTAGTISCFAQLKGEEGLFLVGNHHVIGNSGACAKGNLILQPGTADQGKAPEDTVATLHSWVKLAKDHNKVDCAIAKVNDGIECDVSTIDDLGKWGGFVKGDGVEINMPVAKSGRTTMTTRGVVSAIEVDNLQINYGDKVGVLSFDNQVEILGNDDQDMSAGGDSGSSILDSQNRSVALLFAGGGGVTYANNMNDVLKALKLQAVK